MAASITKIIVSSAALIFLLLTMLLRGDQAVNALSAWHLLDIGYFVIAGLAAAIVVGIAVPKRREWVLVAVASLYLAVGAGIAASASVGIFVLSAYCLGRQCLGIVGQPADNLPLFGESVLVGMGIHLACFGLLIHFPYNYVEVYLCILVLPIVLGAARIGVLIEAAARKVGQGNSTDYIAVCISVAIVTSVARYAFFPSITHDDSALHLRMWTVLSERHIYDFDINSQVWAVAPFTVDLMHAITSMVAQTDSRGALNLMLLGLLIKFLWDVGEKLGLLLEGKLLQIALFASTPVLAALLISLHTELFLAVMSAAGALVILRDRRIVGATDFLVMLMIAALCCSAKVTGALLGILLVFSFVVSIGSRAAWFNLLYSVKWGWFSLLFAVATILALHPYVFAWVTTGNPVFPLYNGVFKSEFFGQYNFVDSTHSTGFSASAFIDMFFDTSKYLESGDLVGGFQYLTLLVASACIALAFGKWRRSAVLLLIPTLGFGVTMFASVQYLRYLFPILPIASMLFAALLSSDNAGFVDVVRRRIVALSISCHVIVNLTFLPGVNWMFATSPSSVYTQSQKEELIGVVAPELALNEYVNKELPLGGVLYERSRPFGATLHGDPVYVNWYSPKRQSQSQLLQNEADMKKFLEENSVEFVFWSTAIPFDLTDKFRGLLSGYLSKYAVPERQIGNMIAYRLTESERLFRGGVLVSDWRQFSLSPELARNVGDDGWFRANKVPRMVGSLETLRSTVAKYSVTLKCPNKSASFIAQINWNVGQPYYRLVQCKSDIVRFVEVIPTPVGASRGAIYLTSRDAEPVLVGELRIEFE